MRVSWLQVWFTGLSLLAASFFVPAEERKSSQTVRIALIIDDLGNHQVAGEAALKLPGPITYAFLPHTPFALEQASKAHQLQKEVMLHLPMESHHGNRLGAGGLMLHMRKPEFLDTLQAALDSVPHVVGINNHMGSLLTRDPTSMRWLMSSIRNAGLFFIDSRTTEKTVAAKVAHKNLVQSASRDVFLDNDGDEQSVREQLAKLINLARKNGSAIGIGHPYPATLAVLAEELPRLMAQGVELVPASQLTKDGSKIWHAYSSPSPKGVKNSKPLPLPIF